MCLSVEKFVTAVVGIIVAVVVTVVIAIPVISSNQVAETVANAASINSMLGIIPLLIVVGIIMAVVGSFLYARKG